MKIKFKIKLGFPDLKFQNTWHTIFWEVQEAACAL
jgi:hypothetical protein